MLAFRLELLKVSCLHTRNHRLLTENSAGSLLYVKRDKCRKDANRFCSAPWVDSQNMDIFCTFNIKLGMSYRVIYLQTTEL